MGWLEIAAALAERTVSVGILAVVAIAVACSFAAGLIVGAFL